LIPSSDQSMGGAAASCVLGLFLAGIEEFWELVVTAFGGKVGGGEFGCYGFCELIPVPGAVWGDIWRGGELSRRDSCSAACARCRRRSDWVIGWGPESEIQGPYVCQCSIVFLLGL
jgi:hypothetical protein